DGYLTISCDISDFGGIQKKLEELGVDAENAELQRIPNTLVTLGDDDFGKVMKLIDALEDNDDVQKVFHNLDITEAQMELL
ncbi:MAG: YebC/PmpR family DNA-binding transcriptional regulator, partial [Cyclobacteriaceae bacterium]|nr:YebC/PmpR family DNA-binding transcriptional regulator [Cyclobacteriaceae bacterium]